MKKLVIGACIMLFTGGASAQQMYLKNTTSCDVKVFLKAHDNTTSDCAYESNGILVAAGSSVLFNNLGDINTWPGWMGGVTSAGTGKWDAAKFYFSGGCGNQVGANCSSSLSWTGACCSGSNITATWIPGTGADVEVTFNP